MCSSPNGRRRRSPTSPPTSRPTDPQRRRDRRRHHGRRHRHEFPQRRHPRHDRRDLEGGARPRRLSHAPQLREHRQEGPPDHGGGRGADGQAHADARLRRPRPGRSRHRSGVREHGHEEERVRAARRHCEARRHPRLQHLLSRHRRNRGEDQAAGRCARHAFLLAGQRDAPARNRARGEDVEIGSCDDPAARAEDRQGRRRRRRLPRLRRQPHARPAPARGDEAHPRGRNALGGRPGRWSNSACRWDRLR